MHDPQTGDDVDLDCSMEETGETKFEAYHAKTHTQPLFRAHVEGGHVFLVSDNRHMHQDSRDFGNVIPTTCQHILIRLWGKGGISDSKSRFNWIW
jgi:signal peptidase I